ncbi:MAG: hypothetical protein M3R17_13365 [Bacteroidota bacterium]|nr:hypothetical protein [Bacteroidota bacterium]
MKKINYRTLLLPLFFLPLLFSSCTMGDWRVYETSEFSIEFPGIVNDTVTMEGKYAGSKSYYEPVPGSLDSNLYYSVSMYSLPDSLSADNDVKGIFDLDANVYAWSIGGTLTDTGRVVSSGDVKGMEYKVTIAGNSGVSTIRKFIIGRHLYTLLVVTENKNLENHAIRKFMDSFKLKKKAQVKK